MTEKLPDVWYSRDYPVLLEVVRRIDSGEVPLPQDVVADALGKSPDEVRLAVGALARRGLVVNTAGRWGGPRTVMGVSGEAYLLTGLHPDTGRDIDDLVEALSQAADRTGNEEDRSRLRRAADTLGGISRDVLTGVLTAYISARIPS